MQKIVTNLWFDENAEEAVRYYTSIFKRSRIVDTAYYSDAAAKRLGRVPGSVLTITFELEEQTFIAINGGPHFSFSPAISLLVNCETQKELDKIWRRLVAKGTPEQCGWLRDRFGVSWQVVPRKLQELMATPGPAADRLFTAMLEMKKLDIEALEAAYAETPLSPAQINSRESLEKPKRRAKNKRKAKV